MRERTRTSRTAALLAAALVVGLATPPTALADADENPWKRWSAQVLDRNTKAEIPLAVFASIPAMIVITPIWLGQVALARLGGEDEDEYEE